MSVASVAIRNFNTADKLSSVSITKNHICRNDSYAFSVYMENGNFHLNAWCVLPLNNEYLNVDIKEILISKDDFDGFIKLDNEYNFLSCVKKGNKSVKVVDKTTYTFNVCYNEESFSLVASGKCYEAVYNYFLKLTEKYC